MYRGRFYFLTCWWLTMLYRPAPPPQQQQPSCCDAFTVQEQPLRPPHQQRRRRHHYDSMTFHNMIAPETSTDQRNYVQQALNRVFIHTDNNVTSVDNMKPSKAEGGHHHHQQQQQRKFDAIDISIQDGQQYNISQQYTVYGELGLDAFITILDAVGVEENEYFLDIGSGDGVLVIAAALLHPTYIQRSIGIELLPNLYQRSMQFQKKLQQVLLNKNKDENVKETTATQDQPTQTVERQVKQANSNYNDDDDNQQSRQQPNYNSIEFILGDIHDTKSHPKLESILQQTTLAICFATTWSRNVPQRRLTQLSKVLSGNKGSNCKESSNDDDGNDNPAANTNNDDSRLGGLPKGARIVIIDGRLNEHDGFDYQGQLKLICPDTAPYSIAHLYKRI